MLCLCADQCVKVGFPNKSLLSVSVMHKTSPSQSPSRLMRTLKIWSIKGQQARVALKVINTILDLIPKYTGHHGKDAKKTDAVTKFGRFLTCLQQEFWSYSPPLEPKYLQIDNLTFCFNLRYSKSDCKSSPGLGRGGAGPPMQPDWPQYAFNNIRDFLPWGGNIWLCHFFRFVCYSVFSPPPGLCLTHLSIETAFFTLITRKGLCFLYPTCSSRLQGSQPAYLPSVLFWDYKQHQQQHLESTMQSTELWCQADIRQLTLMLMVKHLNVQRTEDAVL